MLRSRQIEHSWSVGSAGANGWRNKICMRETVSLGRKLNKAKDLRAESSLGTRKLEMKK
jgi:hypothetical protein